ncbi:MAG: hypothetical protein UY04_C0044G0002 [Parcubacteria group bacterium GW2011_GWA2_47_7]|nr:MAG: hypothetical protein UY04_C0044G0002 [Parcubacteria group bacterium GW2011_GWA2_47_7]
MRTRILLGTLFALFSLWFFAQFVLAEKEANIYIFPSVVTGEGWENADASLGQDLSSDAMLADFTQENSARVFYGFVAATGTMATTSTKTVPTLLTPAPLAPDTEESMHSTSSSTGDSPTVLTPGLPNPFVPEQLLAPVDVVTPPTQEEVISSSTIQSKIEQRMFEWLTVIGHPQFALALESPVSTSTFIEESSVPETPPNPLVPIITNTTPTHALSSSTSPVVPQIHSSSLININGNMSATSVGATGTTASTDESSSFVVPTATSAPLSLPSDISKIKEGTSTIASTTTPLTAPIVQNIESNDIFSVASCTTFGRKCHLMSYEGFGLGGALDKTPLLGATLELSLAGRGSFTSGEYDRVLVRAYHAGHWQYLGATDVRGEISNDKLGGYLKYELSDIGDWADLSDLKIVVEYDRTSDEDASVYLDGIWINARYANDALTDASPDTVALSSVNIRSSLAAKDAEARRARRDQLTLPDGKELVFGNQQEYADATLLVKTDTDMYHVLGEGRTYFNVTNDGTSPEVVRLQFHFPTEGASVQSVSRFVHNVPYRVGQLKYDAIGYSCDGGWSASTSSNMFHCTATDEIRSCDRLNDDRTNCITEGARVGLTEGTEYRDGWEETSVVPGAIADTEGLFAKAVDLLLSRLPEDVIPSTIDPIAHLADSVLLQPGQTMYFRADINVPLNGRGDFYVEAAAQSGEFGLVRATWDGSWNYRAHIEVDNTQVSADGTFAVPVSLDNAPAGFWQHVASDGSDIRFVDETEWTELPYWLASFDATKQTGLVWVRANKKDEGASTTVAMYYGQGTTTSRSNPAAPFRSANLEPRGIIFGGSQLDMTLHVIALDDHVRVSVPNNPEVLLKHGESALFEGMKPSTVISADGPITASVEAPGANAIYVPTGYAGGAFVIPGIGQERELALGVTGGGASHAELLLPDGPVILDPMEGSIVTREITLDESLSLRGVGSMIAVLGTNAFSVPTALYPTTHNDLYGFQVGGSIVGVVADATRFTVLCANQARQNVDGRRVGSIVKAHSCEAGKEVFSGAVRVSDTNNPIGLIDVSGDDLSGALPKSEFASSYISPSDAVGVSVLCAAQEGVLRIGIFDPQGGLMASSTCEARGEYPGKTYIAPPGGIFAAGFSVREISGDVSHPFLAAVQPGAKVSSDGNVHSVLVPLISPQMSRTIGGLQSETHVGAEEFVIPGEHRKLDVDTDGREKNHVDTLLSKDREFSMRQAPSFQFQYKRQSNGLMQGARDVFGVKPFTISRVVLKYSSSNDIPVDYEITYGDNNEWSLLLKDKHGIALPGKYTIHIEIEEGGDTYVDEYDFYWGVLAINFNKTVFTPRENVDISIGALSNNGNTLCDANLKMWITDTFGQEREVLIAPSGLRQPSERQF